jgi:hypothetical protein
MWNFGTMHHQRPKNSDTQRKPSGTSSAPVTPWIPNSALPPVHQDSINSIIRKTLLASPEFPRLYADLVLSTRPNSAEAKILRPKYQKILHRINLMEKQKKLHSYQDLRRPLRLSLSPRRAVLLLPPAHASRGGGVAAVAAAPACLHRGQRIHPGRAGRSHQCAAAQHH